MALDMKHIEERMNAIFKRHRDSKGLTQYQILQLRQFIDDLYDDLVVSDKKTGKDKNNRSKHVQAQIKMIKALRMNNPLWDVE